MFLFFLGLVELLSNAISDSALTPGFLKDIGISQIREAKSLRYEESNIKDLAASIQQKGLLQPILVRTLEGYFEVVAGNRRFHACKALGWKKITCHVIELDDREAFEVSLIENLQRKTLSSLDEATAFKAYVCDFGWGGVTELALRLGKSVGYITKRIKLLRLPQDVLDSIAHHELGTSIAQELFSIKDKADQSTVANLLVSRHMSMRKARRLVKEHEANASDFDHFKSRYIDHAKKAERSFDKTITLLKIAMNNLAEIITSMEDDWILYEILMQHKNMLHSQIDILIKEKRKL